jgi:type I restriction enzyme S subunit
MIRKPLSEIAQAKQWRNLPISQLTTSGFPVYGANGIIGYFHEYNHEHPTIAITCRGATCGNIHITQPKSYITSNAMSLDNLDTLECDIKYLALYLSHRGLKDVTTGAAQPQITRSNLEKIEIPLPPLEDQIRIAHLLSKVECLIAQRKQHLQQLDDLLKSVFERMFGDYIRNESDYDSITKACDFVDYRGKTPARVESGVPLISAKCVRQGHFDESRLDYITDATYEQIMTRGFPVAGDVLFTTEGATFGFTCRIPHSFKKFAVGQRLITMKCNDSYRPIVLDFVLNNTHIQKKLASRRSGSAALGIRSAELAKVEIPFPPVTDQEVFSRIVEKTEPLIDALQTSLKALELLFGVLSQKAFSGKLDLTRVVLPKANNTIQSNDTSISVIEPIDQTFELTTPPVTSLKDAYRARALALAGWLKAYSNHLQSRPFSADEFLELVQQKLSSMEENEDAEWVTEPVGAKDYEQVKAWIFENLHDQQLHQTYDDKKNRVRVSLVKD